jgi:CheY-like chemotaxis protein
VAKKILVVEDEKDSRFVLVCQLRFIGYETVEAETAAQALERALAENPDLIMMDLAMPGVTGIDAARMLKENPATAHIPVVAYTAWDHTRWRQPAFEAGMVEYLVKPALPEVLKATIEKYTAR